jgi:cytochrome c-type biogenesis protein CcmH/NrfG
MKRKLAVWVAVILASAALLVAVFLWGVQRQTAGRDRKLQRIREIDDRITEINRAKANRVMLTSDITRRRELLGETIRLIEEKQDLQEELGASLISRFQSLFH